MAGRMSKQRVLKLGIVLGFVLRGLYVIVDKKVENRVGCIKIPFYFNAAIGCTPVLLDMLQES